MSKHVYNHRSKQIREVVEFRNHLDDLAKRIRGIDIRKMVRS